MLRYFSSGGAYLCTAGVERTKYACRRMLFKIESVLRVLERSGVSLNGGKTHSASKCSQVPNPGTSALMPKELARQMVLLFFRLLTSPFCCVYVTPIYRLYATT